MNKYLILITGKELTNVYETIKSIATGWWKHMPSSMIIGYDGTSSQLRDAITKIHSSKIEKIVVIKLANEGAWRGIKESGSQWLKNNL